jgi:hypothetical protein
MQVTGKVKLVTKTQVVSDKFQKRELVVTTSDQYPQHISIQLSNDKCALADNLAIGQEVTVHINLRGRLWVSPQGEEKYFNTIEGWKIDSNLAF